MLVCIGNTTNFQLRTGNSMMASSHQVNESLEMSPSDTKSEALDVIFEMSEILNTGLDREALSICVSLCEAGVNPEALAAVVKELRRESFAVEAAEGTA
eukprot:m.558936 g.558936  ORF g.558936 m.558936 type:complete len:99 (-) comp22202_c0_seq5:3197-3493(-)